MIDKTDCEESKKFQEDLLTDIMLFKRIVLDGLDDRLVGEDTARMTIFLSAMGSMVINANRTSYNLIVNSDSGAGKDYVTDHILKIFPKEMVHKRTRISPTALTYWHNSVFEPKWTWDRKILYLEDCSNSVINCEVFKVFTSGGSHATIVKDQRAVDIEIKGKPVVILTSASANLQFEMLRRFIVVNLNETKEQTEEVMLKWAENCERGYVHNEDTSYQLALKRLIPQKVKVPFAKKILKHFPSDHIISRTNFTRFLDYVKASAVLHQFSRFKKDYYVHAEEQDYEYVRDIFMNISSNSKTVPLTKSQQETLDVLKSMKKNIIQTTLGEKEIGWSAKEISGNVAVSLQQLYNTLNDLHKYGFIDKETIKLEYSDKPITVYYYRKEKAFYLPKFADL